MQCRDFERLLNSQMDTRDGSAEWDAAIEAHAAACPACRSVFQRYQVLRLALRAWGTPPVPSADFADRVLAARQASVNPIVRRAWARPVMGALAIAASLVVAVTLWVRQRPDAPERPVIT